MIQRVIFSTRYRVIITSYVLGGRVVFLHSMSPLKRGVSIHSAKGVGPSYWFQDIMVKKVSSSFLTKLWKYLWVKYILLRVRFPRIFSIFDH